MPAHGAAVHNEIVLPHPAKKSWRIGRGMIDGVRAKGIRLQRALRLEWNFGQ